MSTPHAPIVGFIATSGSGKTTLLEQLIPRLRDAGLRLAALKHAHHQFDIDIPGKDSHRLRTAGAEQVIIASDRRWAMIREIDDASSAPSLTELIDHFDHRHLDLILIEGFKQEAIPKIVVFRAAAGFETDLMALPGVIAVAADFPAAVQPGIRLLDLNQPDTIARFILQWVENQRQ